MAFRMDKLTIKAQEALQRAQAMATDRGHAEVKPLHLLAALLDESGGVVGTIFDRIGTNRGQLMQIVQSELAHLPKVSGGTESHVDKTLLAALEDAKKQADTMKDDFVSTEHLLLALARVESKAQSLLKLCAVGEPEILKALRSVRGGTRVTDQNPEEKFRSSRSMGSIWSSGRPKANSTRSSGAIRRSVASSRCCRDGRRTIRC